MHRYEANGNGEICMHCGAQIAAGRYWLGRESSIVEPPCGSRAEAHEWLRRASEEEE